MHLFLKNLIYIAIIWGIKCGNFLSYLNITTTCLSFPSGWPDHRVEPGESFLTTGSGVGGGEWVIHHLSIALGCCCWCRAESSPVSQRWRSSDVTVVTVLLYQSSWHSCTPARVGYNNRIECVHLAPPSLCMAFLLKLPTFFSFFLICFLAEVCGFTQIHWKKQWKFCCGSQEMWERHVSTSTD